jgi:hypothetical protein
MDETTSTRTKGTTTVSTKGILYHKHCKRLLWPFGVATTKMEPPLLEATIGSDDSHGKPPAIVVSDTTTVTEQQQMEMGESSSGGLSISSSSSTREPLDREYVTDVLPVPTGTTTSGSNSSSCKTNGMSRNTGRIAAPVTTNNNNRTTTFRIFSCLPCNDMIQAIISRSFYSLASISMIITNKSLDRR